MTNTNQYEASLSAMTPGTSETDGCSSETGEVFSKTMSEVESNGGQTEPCKPPPSDDTSMGSSTMYALQSASTADASTADAVLPYSDLSQCNATAADGLTSEGIGESEDVGTTEGTGTPLAPWTLAIISKQERVVRLPLTLDNLANFRPCGHDGLLGDLPPGLSTEQVYQEMIEILDLHKANLMILREYMRLKEAGVQSDLSPGVLEALSSWHMCDAADGTEEDIVKQHFRKEQGPRR